MMNAAKSMILGFLGLALLPGSAVAQESSAASFEQFRAGLEEAVEQRDWSWFERHLTEGEFLSSLGPFSGPEELVEMWQPQKPDGPFWPELDLLLLVESPLPAGAGGDGTCIGPTPSYGEEELLQENLAALIGNAVPLRSAPAIDAQVIAVVSDDGWVSVIENMRTLMRNRVDWVKIRTSTGREGYVDSYLLKPPTTSKLCYALEDGEWRITGFVGGE